MRGRQLVFASAFLFIVLLLFGAADGENNFVGKKAAFTAIQIYGISKTGTVQYFTIVAANDASAW